jgi:hypothetical protein
MNEHDENPVYRCDIHDEMVQTCAWCRESERICRLHATLGADPPWLEALLGEQSYAYYRQWQRIQFGEGGR